MSGNVFAQIEVEETKKATAASLNEPFQLIYNKLKNNKKCWYG